MEEQFFADEVIDLCVEETKYAIVNFKTGTRDWSGRFWLDSKGLMRCSDLRDDFLAGDRPLSQFIENSLIENLLVKIMQKKIVFNAAETDIYTQFQSLQKYTDDETGEVSYGYEKTPIVVLFALAAEILL